MFTHHSPTPTNPKRVVVYGATGFVGQCLRARLSEKGISNIGVNRTDFDFVDFSAPEKLAAILQPEDTLVILAAITPDKGRGVDPFVNNIQIMRNVCRALEKVTPAHVIYFSSDAVYSGTCETIYDNTLPSPDDLYGAMHFARELMIKSATTAPVAIVRPTLIYGALDTHNSYGPNRLRRVASADKKIKLFGQGEEQRDHIFINDVIDLAILTMQHKSAGTLSFATGQTISYWDLAHKVANNFKEEITIEGTPRQNPITHRHFDVSALHEAFPSFVFTPIEEGLAEAHHGMLQQGKEA